MASASEITNYTGNAGLGLGSNPQIPAINPDADLKVINDTAKNIMLLDHENHVNLWKQKVKERDELYKMLDEGAIKIGAIRDEDRKLVNDAKDGVNKAFFDMIKKGGYKNPDAVMAYKAKVKDLNDVATQAQARYKFLTEEDASIAQTDLADLKDARKKNIDEYLKKGFWANWTPYQQTYSGDIPAMFKKVQDQSSVGGTSSTPTVTNKVTTNPQGKQTTVQTTTLKGGKQTATQTKLPKGVIAVNESQGGKPITKVSELPEISTTIKRNGDLDTYIKNAEEMYLGDGKVSRDHEDQRILKEKFDGQPAYNPDGSSSDLLNMLGAFNNRLREYSIQNGIEPTGKNPDGTDKYDSQIKYFVDPKTKKIAIQETIPALAGKTSLAALNGDYVSKETTANTEIAKLHEQQRLDNQKIAGIKALAGLRRAQAHLTGVKAKILESQNDPIQTWDEISKGKVQTYKTEAGNIVSRVNRSDMTKEFLKNLGIDPLNQDGDYNIVHSNIKFKGLPISEAEAKKSYEEWFYSTPAKKLEAQLGHSPSLEEFMYANGATYDTEIEGKIAPVYKQVTNKKTGKTELQVTNPNEAGKFVRSNRLQSWINQRKDMDVKGTKLIMESSEQDGENASEDNTDISN